jgi:hypothetical protein
MPIFRRCPTCGSDAVLQPESGPKFSEGYYARIFRCRKGHVFVEKQRFCGCEKEVELVGDAEGAE